MWTFSLNEHQYSIRERQKLTQQQLLGAAAEEEDEKQLVSVFVFEL